MTKIDIEATTQEEQTEYVYNKLFRMLNRLSDHGISDFSISDALDRIKNECDEAIAENEYACSKINSEEDFQQQFSEAQQ